MQYQMLKTKFRCYHIARLSISVWSRIVTFQVSKPDIHIVTLSSSGAPTSDTSL